MKYITFFLVSISFSVYAQSDTSRFQDKIEVEQTILLLFEGMRQGDSSMVSAAFAENVRMMTTFVDKEGNYRCEEGSPQDFKNAVGTPHDEVWNERISNVNIQIDGTLAQVWMDFAFYVDDTLSHCGVNAIQLVKSSEGWKMIHIVDTRRFSSCD